MSQGFLSGTASKLGIPLKSLQKIEIPYQFFKGSLNFDTKEILVGGFNPT